MLPLTVRERFEKKGRGKNSHLKFSSVSQRYRKEIGIKLSGDLVRNFCPDYGKNYTKVKVYPFFEVLMHAFILCNFNTIEIFINHFLGYLT